jgi:peptidoglycan hydrolase CwlO-like protein
MSESIIVAIITGGVTVIGFVFTYFSNKKKFDKIANNDMKHVELDPNGETSKKIDGLVTDVQILKTDVQVLKTDVQVLKTDVQVLKADIKGIKHYACTLDGILLDKNVLTNKEAADLNNHLDNN